MLEGEAKGHLHWRVCLGPGRVLEELAPILAHLGRALDPERPEDSGDPGEAPGDRAGTSPRTSHGVRVDQLSDVAELMRAEAGSGRLILAGDGFPEEDIGFVRRFLANNPAWELVVLGRDAGARVARLLLSLERARWVHLPPDLDQLRELARPPAGASRVAPRREPARTPARPSEPELPPPSGASDAGGLPGEPEALEDLEDPEHPDDVLELVGVGGPWDSADRDESPAASPTSSSSGPASSIGTGEVPRDPARAPSPSPAPPGPPAASPGAPEDEPAGRGRTSPEARRPLATPLRRGPLAVPAGARGPAPLGDYVGPLADLVQRVDLSVGLAREAVPGADLAAGEVHQLRQMTHMMKRVAAPPPRGAERFDAGELFEERLAATTIQSPRALRFLPRGERGHHVRADRAAVSEALASLLALARGCASPSGVVLAPFDATPEGCVRLELEFPAGPLAGVDVERLLEPGGLAGRVDGIGAADLPAALSVARSQGGDLLLASEPGDRIRAVLELPLDA